MLLGILFGLLSTEALLMTAPGTKNPLQNHYKPNNKVSLLFVPLGKRLFRKFEAAKRVAKLSVTFVMG